MAQHAAPSGSQESRKQAFMAAIEAEDVQRVEQALLDGMKVDELVLYDGETAAPLHLACLTGNSGIVRRLVEVPGSNVNVQVETGESPLYIASQRGHREAVDVLIRAHADVDLPEIDGGTPLYAASDNGHHLVVDSLVKARADVDSLGGDGCTALYMASQNGHNQVVKLLIRAQADVNLQGGSACTPLYIAAQFGHQEVVDSLVEAQADVDLPELMSGCTSLFIASRQGQRSVVDSLIKAQADVNLLAQNKVSPLIIAAMEGHHQVVDSLISAGADVGIQLDDGATALHAAAEADHFQAVDSLVRAHADVNLQVADGATALYVAAQNGHHRTVRRLLAAGANANLPKRDGVSPLCIASLQGHTPVVRALLRSPGLSLDALAESGVSAVFVAAQHDRVAALKLLIHSQAELNLPDKADCAPLHVASQNGHQKAVKLLIESQADVDAKDNDRATPLYFAAQNGHDRVASLLIRARADVNVRNGTGGTAISIAAEQNHIKVVQLLIKARADVNLQRHTGSTPLYLACQNGHTRVVGALVKAQANVDLPNNARASPIFVASQDGHNGVVKLLIKAGADVDQQLDNGMSPLYCASMNNHLPVVRLLIEARADVNLPESVYGTAPLYIASQNGHSSIAQALIEAKAGIDSRSEDGRTPLYIAALGDHCEVVDLLIKSHADVNLGDVNNCTPLFVASRQGHVKTVDRLIKAQADLDAQNAEGCTALFIASQHGHCEVVDSLIRAQADVNRQGVDDSTPILAASVGGHPRVVESLLRAQADASTPGHNGLTPLQAASLLEHHEVVALLLAAQTGAEDLEYDWSVVDLDDEPECREEISIAPAEPEQLGRRLHSALSLAGFVASRAAVQSAAADVLQEILRRRLAYNDIYVVGSFSEGWGNSLTSLDGKTDIESDIDVMQLVRGRLYHLKGLCTCREGKSAAVEYTNGHIVCQGFAANAALAWRGSPLKPAVDTVPACRLCCYPPIGPLLPPRLSTSNIDASVLQQLRQELATSPCHVVHAAPPGQGGKQLRVSTTFLEKRLLRSLSTLQGQLFVTLKYLVKKVICRRVHGLKSYHVKSVTFRMVEETPAEQWTAENLVGLVTRSLQMLLDCVKSCSDEDGPAAVTKDKVMDHFFLRDAALYLKGADQSSNQEIARVLRYDMKRLPQLLAQFIAGLRPVDAVGTFHFHPFLVLPNVKPMPPPEPPPAALQFHAIYDVVRESLVLLSQPDRSQALQQSLTQLISLLRDCARSAREALRTLACLKFGDRDGALKVLAGCRGHTVSEGLAWPADAPATAAAAEEFVWRHLRSCDSAWKFCFEFRQRPALDFLPAHLADCFPLRLQNYVTFFYVNFDALLHSLRLEFCPGEPDAHDWIERRALRDGADPQELVVGAAFCRDPRLIVKPWRALQEVRSDLPARLDQELRRRLQIPLEAGRSSKSWKSA